jgi:hypothetical protein
MCDKKKSCAGFMGSLAIARDDTVSMVRGGKKWRLVRMSLKNNKLQSNRHFLPHMSPYLPVIPSVSEESFK